MSLQRYTNARLVVQHPDTPAYDALRAMEDNHIGAVVVQEDGDVVGMITDRDLAIQVISYDEDPHQLRLRAIMAHPVELLPVTASEQDAGEAMLERHVRRIPIVDGATLVGMVSDPLVLRAFREIPREEFLPPELAEFAYEDAPLPIGQGQTISQPYIVALTLNALELEPGPWAAPGSEQGPTMASRQKPEAELNLPSGPPQSFGRSALGSRYVRVTSPRSANAIPTPAQVRLSPRRDPVGPAARQCS